ncbi:MAG: 5-formyltetrahydrofolate cyclo-ligase [Tannerella sp.]|jgi:5-formyltetrahydrofolate cyclo-ligase|nr:5-formyltetrahydrofolate cyclo-ligase [Tannerella sp.]
MEARNLDLDNEKRQLRSKIRALKDQYSREILDYKSNIIHETLAGMREFQEASSVTAYVALPDEVQTLSLLENYCQRKKIFLPVVEGNDISFYRYTGYNSLKIGSFGIREPDPDSEKAELSDIDLFLVPGMAFDKNCNRMGRGKGFYDRILKHVKAPVWGVCFDFQLFDNIPVNQQDIKMTKVITDLTTVMAKME